MHSTADTQPNQGVPITATAKKIGKEFMDDDVPGLAAEVAYHAVFAIPAIILLLVLIGAIFENTTDVEVATRLQKLVDERAPSDTQEILTSLIDGAINQTEGGIASFGAVIAALVAIWAGSNATATIMKAFNRAYDLDEDRSFIKKKAVAIGLTLLLGLMINLAFVLFVFGSRIGEWVAEHFGLGNAFELAVSIGRWPLGVLFLMLMFAVLYYFGPNVEQSFRWISPGSVAATVLWIALVLGFSLYMAVASPGSAYGTLSSILVFLTFLYLTAIVMLIGAEINAVLGKQFDPETLEDIEQKQAEGTAAPDALDVGKTGDAGARARPAALQPASATAWATNRAQQADQTDWQTVAKAGAAAAAVLLFGRLIRR